MNRDFIRAARERQIAEAAAAAEAVSNQEATGADIPDTSEDENFGKPEAEITHAIDVSDQAELKRKAMQAHASQIAEDSWFLAMEPEQFALAFGTEWFIRWNHPRAEGDPFLTSIWA